MYVCQRTQNHLCISNRAQTELRPALSCVHPYEPAEARETLDGPAGSKICQWSQYNAENSISNKSWNFPLDLTCYTTIRHLCLMLYGLLFAEEVRETWIKKRQGNLLYGTYCRVICRRLLLYLISIVYTICWNHVPRLNYALCLCWIRGICDLMSSWYLYTILYIIWFICGLLRTCVESGASRLVLFHTLDLCWALSMLSSNASQLVTIQIS